MPWLAHLYVLCKGGDSCRRHRGFHLYLAALIDSRRALLPECITLITTASDEMQFLRPAISLGMFRHGASLLASAKKSCDVRPRSPHLYKKRKGGPAPKRESAAANK